MFLFNKEDVCIGYSIEELSKVREILEKEGINYTYKVINNSGLSTQKGKLGGLKINKDYAKQYIVSVKKNDYERAKYLIIISCIHRITNTIDDTQLII